MRTSVRQPGSGATGRVCRRGWGIAKWIFGKGAWGRSAEAGGQVSLLGAGCAREGVVQELCSSVGKRGSYKNGIHSRELIADFGSWRASESDWCAAEFHVNAAGMLGVRRSAGFASPIC